MDAPSKQLTNQTQAKSRRPPVPPPGHSPPAATALAQPFTKDILEPFTEQFSLLPLRDGLHFRMSCRDLYVPWLTSFQQLITLFKPETPFEVVNPPNMRFALCYVAARAPQQLNKKDLGEYTLRQIQKGKLILQNAKKLNDFLDEYQKKNFANEDEHLAWIEERLSQDVILAHYFSPGHTCWPQFFTSNPDGSSSPVIDLELALLLSSTGVQKYAGNDLAAFCAPIINRSKDSGEPSSWVDQVKQRLSLFNDPVIQEYLDEGKITKEELIRHSRTSSDGVCLDENLKSPLVKQYFDEGFFGALDNRTIFQVIRRCYMTENLSFLLRSPVIRTAYKAGIITDKNIKALRADKPFCPRNILEYFIEHILKDENPQRLAGKFLDYFAQKLKGLERYERLQPLTEEQKADLAMKGVKEAIIGDKLTMADVLERSWKFFGWRAETWLR